MNTSLLRQALKFKNKVPTNSQIKRLYEFASKYQKENDVFFLHVKHGQKPEIVDMDMFFKFLSEENDKSIHSFEDIEELTAKVNSRAENIRISGNSKNTIIGIFSKIVVFQNEDDKPVLYKDHSAIDVKGKILAVENGETFLDIYPIMSKYGFNQFVYLSGFPNVATKDFLEDKEVVFFLDFDIEAIRIYDSITCKTKQFFKPDNIEYYFENYGNQELYKKQRASLPDKHSELDWLLRLIHKHSTVVEQEIIG